MSKSFKSNNPFSNNWGVLIIKNIEQIKLNFENIAHNYNCNKEIQKKTFQLFKQMQEDLSRFDNDIKIGELEQTPEQMMQYLIRLQKHTNRLINELNKLTQEASKQHLEQILVIYTQFLDNCNDIINHTSSMVNFYNPSNPFTKRTNKHP